MAEKGKKTVSFRVGVAAKAAAAFKDQWVTD
jgi:hypothetical protein